MIHEPSTPRWIRWAGLIHAAAVLLTFSSCSSCSKQEVEETDYETMRKEMIQQQRDEQHTVNRMGSFEFTDSLTEGGHRYQYTIQRMPDDSLGIVTDSEGFRTVDNAIVLKVKRDGAQFFSRRFTRQAFRAGIAKEEFQHYVLMNLVFDRITPQGPKFVASVGEAETDELFVQFALTVGLDGSVEIMRHEMFEEDAIHRMEVKE